MPQKLRKPVLLTHGLPEAKLDQAVTRMLRRLGIAAIDEETRSRCWEWPGYRNDDGYGQIRVGGVMWYVHRFAYAALIGPIPPKRELDHRCHRRHCCNPWHMQPVTHATNMRRMRRRIKRLYTLHHIDD